MEAQKEQLEKDLFSNIIGNENIKLQLRIAIKSALIQNTAIPHMIFNGPPGCGKTTVARLIASSMDSTFFSVTSEQLKKTKDFLHIFNKFGLEGYDDFGDKKGQIFPPILFIDEIHQLNIKGQEILGIAMEDFIIEAPSESKFSDVKQMATFWIPRFTVVGATTIIGQLSKPFQDRFKICLDFKKYTEDECARIAKLKAADKGIAISDEAANEIAVRSRGTPRIVVRLLDRIYDAAIVLGKSCINQELALTIFKMIGLDSEGLGEREINIMLALYETAVPLGIDVLSVIAQEDKKTIATSIEPYLISRGFILRTKKGRMITEKGVDHLKKHKHIKPTKGSGLIKLER